MMPLRETNPTVGLIPTTPFVTAGQIIEPLVSVPTAAAQRFAETATPDRSLIRTDFDRENMDYSSEVRGPTSH
jgi:hypothetical protein